MDEQPASSQSVQGTERSLDVAELRSRVTVVADRVVLFREIPVQTIGSVTALHDRFDELTSGWDRFAYVIDLREAKRPRAEVRAELKRRLRPIVPRVVLAVFVVGDNLVMLAMAKIVAYSLGLWHVQVFREMDEAIEAARNAVE